MKRIFLFLILFTQAWLLSAQYSENFTGQNGKGLVDAICPPTATGINDCGCICSVGASDNTSSCTVVPPDLTGVTWSITSANFTGFDHTSPDDFGVVNERFESSDPDNEMCWVSPVLNIAGAGAVSISFNAGDIDELESDDYIRGEYSLDGGSFVPFGTATGATGDLSMTNFSITGLMGTTLIVRICIDGNGGTEIIWFDNVSVPQAGVFIDLCGVIGDSDSDGTCDDVDGCPNDPNKIAPGICGCGVADTDTDNDGTADCNDGCPNDPDKIAPGICGCGVADTDSDNDGTADCNDGCPSDPNKTDPGACGCGVADTDTDNDGTADCNDGCPTDPDKIAPGICGCGVADTDTDNDGTADCNDGCPNDPNKIAPGVCGCGVADTDTDNDGTPDCNDGCPNDPNKIAPGVCGCGVADTDTDNDGTADCNDGCPNDPNKIAPGVCGCGVADTDSDNDGFLDCNDGCPDDPNKIEPGVCGCGVADTDTDNDGTPDCNDGCPDDPNKIEPGVCGCGVADTDTDNDGTPDCNDGCPDDPNKIEPGVCGCGVADTDTDNDGTPDCNDGCPNDPNKIAPGVCGCGVADTDSDNDGFLDCNDGCPDDPNKIEPGVCGCGVADTDTDNDGTADCNDGCPDDPNKIAPGVCGCGVADTDTDNDGTADCNDGCPNDPNKIAPGICGCGVADTDTDNDGTPDCNDGCPDDPNKIEPGVCGCGVADTDSDLDGIADCLDNCPLSDDNIVNLNTSTCDCELGYYATYTMIGDNQILTDCTECPPGTYCPDGINSFPCPPGYFSDLSGQIACTPCAAGTFNDMLGATSCENCPLGENSQEGATECFADADNDNVLDDIDNCLGISNPLQEDADLDGAGDACDGCPDDPNKIEPGICGCGVADTDTDNDGTADCNDGCPDDPNKIEPGICGCGVADTDTDNDGTADCNDGCPNDPNKIEPGICGCGVADTDTDNDGTADCNDGCPNDPNKIEPGICGCGVADTDTDNDGTPDCNDGCPDDPNKIEPGICGCGVADTDTDNDGTPDCNDGCPDDPNKIEPGICGCGVADTDTDNDGTADCNDGCPDDPNKIEPGVCGCGVADTDTDNDGTPDCNDGCPDDPNKIEPGICGCNSPEPGSSCDDGNPLTINDMIQGDCNCAGVVPCDLQITDVSATKESCPGDNDGSITITATTSYGPLTYTIDGPVMMSNGTGIFTNLPPGSYAISVIDNGTANCEAADASSVAVGDSGLPVAVCLNPAVFIDPDGTYTLDETEVLDFVNSTDDCGFTVSSISPLVMLDCAVEGQVIPVTVTITDGSNNTDDCEANVTLINPIGIPDPWDDTAIGSAPNTLFDFDACAEWPSDPSARFEIITGAVSSLPNQDNVALIHQTLCGDGSVTLKVESVSPNGFAGIMFSEDLSSSGRQASVLTNLTNQLRGEVRLQPNMIEITQTQQGLNPMWLRLARKDDRISGFFSNDGVNFNLLRRITVDFDDCIEVGMVAYATLPTQVIAAIFSNVEVEGGSTQTLLPDDWNAQGLIYDANGEVQWSLYPNPAFHEIVVESNRVYETNLRVQIVNSLGELVANGLIEADNTQTVIDVTALPSGIYTVQVLDNSQVVQTLRFVRQE